VGKSVVAASICAALAAGGERVAAFKPVVTGLDEEPGEFGRDHELLAAAASAGQAPEDVTPYLFAAPVSPHFAAQQERTRIEPSALLHAARAHELVVCEGVGGLMVPITPGYLVRDLAIDLGLPMVIVARAGLGTINHTLLTIEAARAGGIEVVAVVITPWPGDPSSMQKSNRDTIERLGAVPVHALPPTTPDRLAEAGAALPVQDWLRG
jgi:dethiobiotin synthetase